MSLFKPFVPEQAYLKVGLFGFAGSGKTYTSSLIAAGLHNLLREKKLPGGNSPIFFADTEVGSGWVADLITTPAGQPLIAKTRAFADLISMVREVEKTGGVLLVDSLTHFWTELCRAYKRKKNRKYGLEMRDWAELKDEWSVFATQIVNSQAHLILAGRAGFEYDTEENEETGKRTSFRSGKKMAAEKETGHEPNLLIDMIQEKTLETGGHQTVIRWADVIKDRGRTLDGKRFPNPTFKDFLPHILKLNLGGTHVGFDESRTSDRIIPGNERSQWEVNKKLASICRDEIKEAMVKHYPGQSAADKKAKADLLDEFFGTRSWEAVEELKLDKLTAARNAMWIKLEGKPYGLPQPAAAEEPAQLAVETF